MLREFQIEIRNTLHIKLRNTESLKENITVEKLSN